MEIIKSDINFDFIGRRKFGAIFSAAAIAVALISLVGLKVNLGIDFTGGVELQIRSESQITIEEVRKAVAETGLSASVQSYGDAEEGSEYLVRNPLNEEIPAKEVSDKVVKQLESSFGEGTFVIDRVDVVGPKVGEELRSKGIQSLLYALVGILLYVWFRFELRYAVGAIMALAHDVVIVVGLFTLLGKEFNLPTIAALLTIIGYSLNDTVVVFDRIRENRGRNRRGAFGDVINRSINETLSRTMLTSITTLITVLALSMMTQVGSVIHDFAFALICGVLIGTYSSIFVASPALLLKD